MVNTYHIDSKHKKYHQLSGSRKSSCHPIDELTRDIPKGTREWIRERVRYERLLEKEMDEEE